LNKQKPYRIIISGGGTGGHIFPALAIANEFRERHPDAQILFVGAKGKMEMTRVPDAGYRIIGLWISGLQRKLTLSNLLFPIKLMVSYVRAWFIAKRFNPDAVVGTGGYASGPIMLAATKMKIPTIIQEQNSFAGLANKQVAAKASVICVAYEGMEKYFPANKIKLTGNPVRKDILSAVDKRKEALAYFGFSDIQKTVLVIGGSLGARTINESIMQGLDKLIENNIQIIWQTGKSNYHTYSQTLAEMDSRKVRAYDFIKQMDLAYAAADVVVSRSGALAVSELCIAAKPVILVPSPNVAEDHQTKNAMALVNKSAARIIKDTDAATHLVNEILKLVFDEQACHQLSTSIKALAKPNATKEIVNELELLVK
jgi:UDP-N-acetylglucosamine--N-acetylmuramyl-(pentapeptide) pyrophosphoryl-undecaprenol N-acetylglucosamine transferase